MFEAKLLDLINKFVPINRSVILESNCGLTVL